MSLEARKAKFIQTNLIKSICTFYEIEMSGCGNPCGGGGGRGRTSGRRTPLQSNKPVNRKKTIKEYYFYVGSSKQASDYETTSEYIINYIKKTFDRGNDIA